MRDKGALASERILVALLRFVGALDILALIAALAPSDWFRAAHDALGIGDFPDAAITGYLARSAALMYALHGALILWISLDIRAHWRLVRFLAWAAFAHGLLLIGVDIAERLPLWWTIGEGGSYLGLAACILGLQSAADRARRA